MRTLMFSILLIIVSIFPYAQNPKNQNLKNVENKAFLPIVYQVRAPIQHTPILEWAYGGCLNSNSNHYCDTGWYSSPVILDFDGDGASEVIAGQEHIFFLRGDNGQPKYLPYTLSGRAWPGLVAGDFNSDTFPEVAAADGNGRIYMFGYRPGLSNYEYLWVKTEDNCSGGTCFEVRSLAAGDLNGDNTIELVTGSTRPMYQWRVYSFDGTSYPGDWPQHEQNSPENGYAAGCFNENIALGNIWGDTNLEIVGPSDVHYINVFQENGEQVPANAMYGLLPDQSHKPWGSVGIHRDHYVDLRGYANCAAGELRPNFANSAPIIVDVNADGIKEIVVVGNMYSCVEPYTDLYYSPYIFNGDRTRWSGSGFNWTVLPEVLPGTEPLSEDYSIIENAVPNPVVVDLDGDGYKEIIYPSYDGKMHAVWLDKTEHGEWPFNVYHPSDGFLQFASEPVVIDFEGDGLSELIFTTWTQKGSASTGYLYILRWDGSIMHRLALPGGDYNASWNGGLGAPTLGNIDADTNLEVVINTAHSGIIAYELSNSMGSTILWQTGRGNYLRDGQP